MSGAGKCPCHGCTEEQDDRPHATTTGPASTATPSGSGHT